MRADLGKHKLLTALCAAETSAEITSLAARHATERLSDGALFYGDSATPGVLHVLASHGLPSTVAEAAPSLPDRGGEPVCFELEPPPKGEVSWAPLREPALAAGMRHGLLVWLHSEDAVVGCAVLLWRDRPGDGALHAARELAALVGPALGRALKTDRMRWERDILMSVLPLLSEGVLCVTLDGEPIIYSQRLEELVGWTAEDVRERGWTNLVYPDPDYRAELMRGIAALVMGRPSEGVERTLARADGHSIQAAIWSRMVPHPSGGPPALAGVLRDVTAQREAARSQQREESLVQLGRLASTVAHDLNNLLCSVMGYTDLLTLPGLTPEQREQHAATVLSAAESGGRLVQQLLLLSGTTRARPTPLDVGRAVRQALRLFQPELSGTIRARFSADPELPLVEADPLQLQQALLNLLANARDAMGSGGGEITLSVSLATVPDAALLRAPDAPPAGSPAVRIQVRDTGPGFSKEAMEHLLEPFFTTKTGGHGLGLAAVRAAVTQSRGALDMQNEGGALITLYLPISQRPELALPQLAVDSVGAGRRIWIAEDQEQVLEFSRISLESMGYEVQTFTRAADVMKAAKHPPAWPDLLILDAGLKTTAEEDLLTALRAQGLAMPVILINAYTPTEPLPPDAAYVQKPFTGRALAQCAARLLSKSS